MRKITPFLLLGFALLVGCTSQNKNSDHTNEKNATEVTQGAWTNRYKGDDNLAGVVVQQFADGDDGYPLEERKGKHPSMIIYAFWDESFRQIEYSPSGEITSDFRFQTNDATGGTWCLVDFSHGSDPLFEKHIDPRIKWCPPES